MGGAKKMGKTEPNFQERLIPKHLHKVRKKGEVSYDSNSTQYFHSPLASWMNDQKYLKTKL